MPSHHLLRLRLRLMAELDQLAMRLDHQDPLALTEAKDRLMGLAMTADCSTMAMVIRAMSRTLADMQTELDRGGWTLDDDRCDEQHDEH